MKILITYYIPSGGVETLNRQRYAALRSRGIECHFLYQWPGNGSQDEQASIPVHVTDDDDQIKQLLITHQYDVVIVNSNHMMLERIRRCGYSKTVIYECQGLGSLEQTIGSLLEALPYIHSCSNAILYPKTEHMKQLFSALYPTIRQYSFHNCLDTRTFTYKRPSNTEHTKPIIGWVGRIERNKNWRAFLHMAKAWIKHDPQLTIWMFEDAYLYEEDERSAYEKELQDDLLLRSRLIRHMNVPHTEMPEKYSLIGDSGGFLCSTSKTEGFGYALLEAMSCRCPVLASDSDGPRSFIKHDQTGKMYPADEYGAGIHRGITYLTKHAEREKIRLAGQRYVQQQFSPSAYADHFIAMLRSLHVLAR